MNQSRRLNGAAALLALTLPLLGCGGGSGSPTRQSSTPTPTPVIVAAQATLGSAGFFPGHDDKGFGRRDPGVIYNGGDPVGLVRQIQWRDWGAATASGSGIGSAIKPGGGYYHQPVTVQLRADHLGACNGHPGYHRLMSRRQVRPNGPFGPWESWWPAPHADLCGSAF